MSLVMELIIWGDFHMNKGINYKLNLFLSIQVNVRFREDLSSHLNMAFFKFLSLSKMCQIIPGVPSKLCLYMCSLWHTDRRVSKVMLWEFASQSFAASHSSQESYACYSAACGESQNGRKTKAEEIHLRAGTSMDSLHEIARSVNTTDIIMTATLTG